MQDVRKRITVLLLFAVLCITGCGEESEGAGLDEIQAQSEKEPDAKDDGRSEASGKAQETWETLEEGQEPEGKICVFVCGEVASPGVYELASDSRIYQAVEAAGGLLDSAAGDYVNQAERMADGQRIYIPSLEEARTGVPEPADAGGGAQKPENSEGKVNLNTAGKEELMTLTGIGEKKAEAIISYRDASGGFGSIDELMQVEGIKEGTFEKIKEDIVI